MALWPGTHILLHGGQLEYFGWEVYAAFAAGSVAVCLLINLLASRDLKKLRAGKRNRKRYRLMN